MQRAHCYLLMIGAVFRSPVSCGWICSSSSCDRDGGAVFYGHVKQVDCRKSHVPAQ